MKFDQKCGAIEACSRKSLTVASVVDADAMYFSQPLFSVVIINKNLERPYFFICSKFCVLATVKTFFYYCHLFFQIGLPISSVFLSDIPRLSGCAQIPTFSYLIQL